MKNRKILLGALLLTTTSLMVACSNTKTSNNTDNSSSVVKKETKKEYTETQKKVIEKGHWKRSLKKVVSTFLLQGKKWNMLNYKAML